MSLFNPETFYELAKLMKMELIKNVPNNLHESTYRTCISRAYYSVFLSLRKDLIKIPISNNKIKNSLLTGVSHAIIAESIKGVDFKIGNYIINLRKLRNKADYKIDEHIDIKDVDYSFKITNEIFKSLSIINKLREEDIVNAWNKIIRSKRER